MLTEDELIREDDPEATKKKNAADAAQLQDGVVTMDKIHERYAENDYQFVRYFIQRMLNEWEDEIDQRPDEVKKSIKGKEERVRFRLLKEDLKPLMTSLKKQVRLTHVMLCSLSAYGIPASGRRHSGSCVQNHSSFGGT